MKKSRTDDVLFVLGKAGEEPASRYRVVRRRASKEEVRIEAGELRPLEEGKPIDGEVVTLTARAESPRLFDVRTEYEPPNRDASGPARVATRDYRKGWDKIWGRRPPAPPN